MTFRINEWAKANPEKRKATVKRHRDKVRQWVNAYKMSKGCIDCGYKEHPAALSLDHVRGEKIQRVSILHSLTAVMKEVDKCVVRCHNCHAIRHYTDPKPYRGEKFQEVKLKLEEKIDGRTETSSK